jgi:hypothetical protein
LSCRPMQSILLVLEGTQKSMYDAWMQYLNSTGI